MTEDPKKNQLQTIIITSCALALIGIVVVGLSSLRRIAEVSPSIIRPGESLSPPAPATPEQAQARSQMLELCRERLARVADLGRHLEAPVLKTAPVEKWDLDSNEGRQLFENAQKAVGAYVHALISNTEALKTAALKASPTTTYGRKVIEARRLQREIEKLDLQIFNERKRTGL
jgi:hypothetical protein